MPRITTIVAGSLTLVVAMATLSGCGAVSVIHDTMIGPISPAGRIEPIISGRSFQVGERGISVARTGEPRLRAYPPDLGSRFRGVDGLIGGARFAVLGQSFVAHQVVRTGTPVEEDDLDRLVIGETRPGEAAAILGPPNLWLRRPAGDLMGWGDARRRHVLIRIGPGAASQFIPVPFIGNLTLNLGFGAGAPGRVTLIFSPKGVLTTVVDSRGLSEGDLGDDGS